MTIVRNITSHSEHAAAVEAGLYSNSLASSASSSAFLLEVLCGGTPMSNVPGLVEAAEDFIREASAVAQRKSSSGKQSFRNLIPLRVAVQVVGDPEKLRDVAEALTIVLSEYRSAGTSGEDLPQLIGRLDEFADDFSAHAIQVPRVILASG